MVQGTKGLFQGYPHRVHIEGLSPGHEWQDWMDLRDKYDHPLWKDLEEQSAGAGHGGMDFIEDYRLVKCLRAGEPTDMNVYDAAAMSVITPLSEWSVANRSRPIDVPDFTRGRWAQWPNWKFLERRKRRIVMKRFRVTGLTSFALGWLVVSTPAQEITLALTGDAIITRRLSVYEEPDFLELIDMIRGADAAFTNLEVLFHDYEPYPAHQSGGTWMRGEPILAKELVWAGIDMVSRANNHTGDYGVEGLRLTTKYVDEAGLVHAGAGESLAEAREARFLETARGRVALISMASTFPDHSRAGNARGSMKSRPGLSPLRYTTERVATAEQLDRFQGLAEEMGLNFNRSDRGARTLSTNFIEGSETGVVTRPNAEDMAEIAAVVQSASRLADQVIVTIHAHESGGARSVPAGFLVEFARAMVDAGATMFVGHGPHVLRGIEIYKGKPIFYSLGDFVFQNETLLRLPDENYQAYDLGVNDHVADFNARRYQNETVGFPANPEIWEAVVAMPTFTGDELTELALHPITLGYGKPAWVRGRPMLAHGVLAKKILNDLVERSKPFGTEIDIREGVGYVRVR